MYNFYLCESTFGLGEGGGGTSPCMSNGTLQNCSLPLESTNDFSMDDIPIQPHSLYRDAPYSYSFMHIFLHTIFIALTEGILVNNLMNRLNI